MRSDQKRHSLSALLFATCLLLAPLATGCVVEDGHAPHHDAEEGQPHGEEEGHHHGDAEVEHEPAYPDEVEGDAELDLGDDEEHETPHDDHPGEGHEHSE